MLVHVRAGMLEWAAIGSVLQVDITYGHRVGVWVRAAAVFRGCVLSILMVSNCMLDICIWFSNIFFWSCIICKQAFSFG